MMTGSSITFWNGNSSYNTLPIYNNSTGAAMPRADAGYYGLDYYRWSTWVGFRANSYSEIVRTPLPIFWNGRDLWYPSSISLGSTYTGSAEPLASFDAGGIVAQRPPAVYYNPDTDRVTAETQNGFVDFMYSNPSGGRAYVYTASYGSTPFVKAQAYRSSAGGSYANYWANQTYDFNGSPEEANAYKYVGSHSPKAMMGNVQLYFGALDIKPASNPSNNWVYYIDNNIFRMVV
jgi:hypothetical protein